MATNKAYNNLAAGFVATAALLAAGDALASKQCKTTTTCIDAVVTPPANNNVTSSRRHRAPVVARASAPVAAPQEPRSMVLTLDPATLEALRKPVEPVAAPPPGPGAGLTGWVTIQPGQRIPMDRGEFTDDDNKKDLKYAYAHCRIKLKSILYSECKTIGAHWHSERVVIDGVSPDGKVRKVLGPELVTTDKVVGAQIGPGYGLFALGAGQFAVQTTLGIEQLNIAEKTYKLTANLDAQAIASIKAGGYNLFGSLSCGGVTVANGSTTSNVSSVCAIGNSGSSNQYGYGNTYSPSAPITTTITSSYSGALTGPSGVQ